MNIPWKHFQRMKTWYLVEILIFPPPGQELARIAHLWGEQVENPKHAEKGEKLPQNV